MKERPIIFDAESVRAILDGTKTQTRRVVRDQSRAVFVPCPYGAPGDRMWVREAWRLWGWDEDFSGASIGYKDAQCKWCDFPDGDYERWLDWLIEESDKFEALPGVAWDEDEERYDIADKSVIPWRSPIHMPRWASRITLEVTGVRVERLQMISEDDARAEGVDGDSHPGTHVGRCRGNFARRWDDINAKRGYPWSSNPWVWVVTFKRDKEAAE